MLRSLFHRLLPRSYITDRHGVISRWAIGTAGFLLALAVTRSPTLAREVFGKIRADDFATGLGRLAWYVRRRFPKADMSVDPLYLPCAEMRSAELVAMRNFLTRHGGRIRPDLLLGDLCFISASNLVATFGTPEYEGELGRFRADADALLRESLRREVPAPIAHDVAEAPAGVPRSGFCRAEAEISLRDGIALLEKGGFRPFILSGTLLGAVREGHILDHDYDIDLGLFADETDLARLDQLLKTSADFRLLKHEDQTVFRMDQGVAQRLDLPVIYKIRHRNGIVLDVFLHYREGGGIWHGTALYRWENSPFTLSALDLAGIRVAAPANADQNLTENYGNWREPVYGFNCAIDTPNLVLHPGPLSLAVALRRLMLLSQRPKDADRLLAQMQEAGFIEADPVHGWKISHLAFAHQPHLKDLSA